MATYKTIWDKLKQNKQVTLRLHKTTKIMTVKKAISRCKLEDTPYQNTTNYNKHEKLSFSEVSPIQDTDYVFFTIYLINKIDDSI